jgi:predicted small lipoprotein YifL
MTVLQRFVFLLLPALLSVGCGQKGPLYLEGREPPSQRAPAAKTQPTAQQKQAPDGKEKESIPEEQY